MSLSVLAAGRARPALAAAMIGIIGGVAASMAMNMPTMTAAGD